MSECGTSVFGMAMGGRLHLWEWEGELVFSTSLGTGGSSSGKGSSLPRSSSFLGLGPPMMAANRGLTWIHQ